MRVSTILLFNVSFWGCGGEVDSDIRSRHEDPAETSGAFEARARRRPNAPTSLAVSVISQSQLKLTWQDNSGDEEGYRIERALISAGPFALVTKIAANSTLFNDTNRSSGTKYYYRVFAYRGSTSSYSSNIASGTTLADPTALAEPSALAATAVSDTQINLAWADNSDNEVGFRVEQSADGGATYSEIVNTPADTTIHSVTGLAAATTYSYRVVAYNEVDASAFSNLASATTNDTPEPPVAPSGLTATAVSSSQINLAWVDGSENESGFKVERSSDGGATYSEIATLVSNSSNYAATGLSPSVSYWFQIRAYNAVENSAYSNAASATTSGAPTESCTHYVDNVNGSDLNSGTAIGEPRKTIVKGLALIGPGKTLCIRDRGTVYAENLYNIPSGNSASPVTVSGFPGEKPTIKPASGGHTFYLAGDKSYIKVKSLILDGTNTTDANVYYYRGSGGSPNHITLEDSEVKNGRTQGVIIESGGSAYPSPDYNVFRNLYVHDNGTTDFHHGFYIQSNHNLIENCEIAYHMGWGMQIYRDADLLKAPVTTAASYNVVRNNSIHHNARSGTRGVGLGIYIGTGNQAYNNLIWGENITGIVIAYNAQDAKVFNNTIHGNFQKDLYGKIRGDGGIFMGFTGAIRPMVMNNIAYNNGNYSIVTFADVISPAVANNFASDPKFVNAAAGDFHLQAGSGAIDTGLVLPEVTTDREGTPRPMGVSQDIGAYEQ